MERRGGGKGGRGGGGGLLHRHWESVPSKGQRVLATEARAIAASSFLLAPSPGTNVDSQLARHRGKNIAECARGGT